MPSREEQEWLNAASKSRQQRTRAERVAEKGIRDRERAALGRATSTSQRRAIKEQADQERKQSGLLQNVDTNAPKETTNNRTDVDSDSNQRGTDDFKPSYNQDSLGGSGGGSGLPEYPGDDPSINIKAPLIWDGNNGDARWLTGETVPQNDPNVYFDVFGYDPNPSFDNYSLFRLEVKQVILCVDGEPVTGQILFSELQV